MSNTPRTDAVVRNCETASRETQRLEYLAHARQLERELAQMTHLAHKFDNKAASLSEVCHDVNRDLARERRRVVALVDAVCEDGMYWSRHYLATGSAWRCTKAERLINRIGWRHDSDGKLEEIK